MNTALDDKEKAKKYISDLRLMFAECNCPSLSNNAEDLDIECYGACKNTKICEKLDELGKLIEG